MNRLQKMEVKATKAFEKAYCINKMSNSRFRKYRKSLRDIVKWADVDPYDHCKNERDFWQSIIRYNNQL